MFGSVKEKANAIANIPDQVRTITLIVIGIGMLNIIALIMVAVRHAN